ncbi:disulfide bond formation protein B [Alphaproteobacteria bacterium]|jgi:disulfide bond formation protein DsbB|nr:disulfide bond formation protein B [Alphaproteobacteria bacterium]
MTNNNIYKISLLASSLMLLSAFYLEYFEDALPCELCITQRWFHGLIITYSLISIFILEKFINVKIFILIVLSFTWLVSAIAGLYHFGIEMNFWLGPDDCSSNIDFSKDLLTYLLNKSPIKCDEIMFKILGLSLAGWNALLSFLMSLAISYFIIFKRSLSI